MMYVKKIGSTCVLYALLFFVFTGGVASVHQARFAGSWYPEGHEQVTALLQSLEQKAAAQFDVAVDGAQIRALVVPHAGLAYSGSVAMGAYRLVKKSDIDRVIFIAPSHTAALEGAAVPSWNRIQMAGQVLSLDIASIDRLAKKRPFQKKDAALEQEHAIEVQLPFVHYFWPRAKVLPIVVGDISASGADEIAAALLPFISPRTLVVATSDLTHYGAQYGYTPFAKQAELQVRQLDSQALWLLQQHDRAGLRAFFQKTGATVCGKAPMDVLLALIEKKAFGDVHTRLVAYGTSRGAATNGNSGNFVSYGGLIVSRQRPDASWGQLEKTMLLTYARDVLTQSLKKSVDVALLKPLLTPLLQQPCAVFVTLYKKTGTEKALRGCIGTTRALQPAYQAVAEMVIAAAHDPRFPEPVRADELSSLIIEISVLTQPKPVASYHDIVLNKHGIVLTLGGATALFLPRVPQEYGFTFEKTMAELSQKAGLAEDAWKSPEARFEVFEAVDFAETALSRAAVA